MCPPMPNDERGSLSSRRRVVLVESHALLGAMLAMRLDQEPDFEVAALCASLAQARNVDLRKCDLAIIDVYLPDGSGAELIRELHDAVARPIPAIALTEVRDPKVDARTSRAGAREVRTPKSPNGPLLAHHAPEFVPASAVCRVLAHIRNHRPVARAARVGQRRARREDVHRRHHQQGYAVRGPKGRASPSFSPPFFSFGEGMLSHAEGRRIGRMAHFGEEGLRPQRAPEAIASIHGIAQEGDRQATAGIPKQSL